MRNDRIALALAAFATFASPQVVSAHAKLVASSPAANARVAPLSRIELRFNEAIIAPTLRAQLAMTGMPGMASHAPMPITGFSTRLAKNRKSATLLLRRPLTAGTYQVTWSAAGGDTHRMGGNFNFTVR